jgi:VIT1/CCC1 family predicted Fe2+/Mn2+ transporter
MARDSEIAVENLLERNKGILDPVDRSAEIIFGLIMALTFTCTLSVATSGRSDVREMLIGALGCNLAWGLVDTVMYAITAVVQRARRRTLVRAVQKTADPARAVHWVRLALPEGVSEVMDDAGVGDLVARLRSLPPVQGVAKLHASDLREACLAGLLVFLATFPVAVPFMLIQDAGPALRVSNAVAVAMMFVSGASLARASGLRAWVLGGLMVVLGVVLVGITIALGG